MAKGKITAVKYIIKDGKKIGGKSFAFELDPVDFVELKTEATVRKRVEEYILKGGVFKKEDVMDLKYSGLKDFFQAWKDARKKKEEENPDSLNIADETRPLKNYDLERFVTAQEIVYDDVIQELTDGRKYSHWIWYIFPQQKGLGHSYNSQYYGLDGEEEARAYLAHPVLGPRLRECCQLVLSHEGKRNIDQIMGSGIDVLKLQTSMNIFNRVSPNDLFQEILEKMFD